MDLSHNLLQDELPSFNGMDYLQSLDISYNFLSGEITDQFVSAPSLVALIVSSNSFSGSLPPYLIDNANSTLDTLDISMNGFSGNVSKFFLPELTNLNI